MPSYRKIRNMALDVPPARSWAVEVRVKNESGWCGNGLRFEAHRDAVAYAQDLAARWTHVEKWRVVPTNDPLSPTIQMH